MRRTQLCWIAGLFCALLSLKTVAQSTDDYVRQIMKPSHDSARILAIRQLAALRQPVTFPLLAAINEKRLYVLDGKPVTTGVSTPETDDETLPLYWLYPVYEPVKNEKGQPRQAKITDLQLVEVTRPERLALADIVPFLNLTNTDPKKRMTAYGQLMATPDLEKAAILSQLLTTETDPETRRVGLELVYNLRLQKAGSAAIAKAYIDSLSDNWGENTVSMLKTYAAQASYPNESRIYAAETAETLQSQNDWLQKIQNAFSGLSLGSILILIALGLSIVYGLAGVINMAHGEFMMIGAYTTYCIQVFFTNTLGLAQSDLFFWVSLPLSFLMAGVWGFALERLVIRHLYSRPLESLLATWGVSLILVQTARSIFGDLTAVKTPALLSGGWNILPHLVLPYNRLFIIGLTVVVVALTYLMLYRSRLGLQIRSVTQNRNMSASLGIETRRVDAMTFFLGSGLAGLAGCAMTLIGNVVPDMGQTYIVDSFLVVVTGGVGKIAGAIVSGIGIGFSTKILESFFEAVYGKVFILMLIILFLQFKPKGLFPDKGRIAED